MLITCPSCQAEYNVPGPLAPGRAVKCAKCGGKWQPVPLPPEPEPEPEPEPVFEEPVFEPHPEPAPFHAPAEPLVQIQPRTRRKRPSLLTVAWILSGLILAGLIAAVIVLREPLMHLWPPSARLYGWLHLR